MRRRPSVDVGAGRGGRRGSLGVSCCRKEGCDDDWAFSGEGGTWTTSDVLVLFIIVFNPKAILNYVLHFIDNSS